jgi:Tol biopolymer transport system component
MVSIDGRYIFFTSNRSGKETILRMDIDGRNIKQLISGEGFPVPSPDGKWVFYSLRDPTTKAAFWKVPVEGGEPVLINGPRGINGPPLVSPNGKDIATGYWDGELDLTAGIAIFPIEGGQPIKRLNLQLHVDSEANTAMWGWALNGRALLYIDDNLANIWSHPIDGSKPTRLTDFQGDELFYFAYSRDGKWLAVARGRVTEDVVMITDSQ